VHGSGQTPRTPRRVRGPPPLRRRGACALSPGGGQERHGPSWFSSGSGTRASCSGDGC
jgi:hypothetical protein